MDQNLSNPVTPARREPAGVYLHWPFCERKCPYCDFYTFGREHPWARRAEAYRAALIAEIDAAPARLAGSTGHPAVDTVYFGGGTPSLAGPAAIGAILGALRRSFALDPGAELTLEVNPTTAETAGLEALLALGINRLSVGCQSFNDRLLGQLGRVHDAATTRRAIGRMRAAGVTNLSLDIIFGVPTQTVAELRADLAELLAFAPEHISAYNLTVHEGTPYGRWARAGRLALPEEEATAAMFELLMDELAAAGYEHYEISNWARPGRRSRHNSKYWRDADVLGLGVAAHSVWRGQRSANPADLNAYLDPARRTLGEPLDPPAGERARAGEVMMLVLRRVDGVAWPEIDRWLGFAAREYYQAELARLAADGLIDASAQGLRLTRTGILLADTVMEAFF